MTLVLAPLRGITGAVFRSRYSEFFSGLDSAVAPFITAVNARNMTERRFRGLKDAPSSSIAIVPQLIGNRADDFVRMAHELQRAGFNTINWNLGCPSGTVTKKKRGAGLLPFPEHIDSFLAMVFPRIDCALTVKMRLGMTHNNEMKPVLETLNRYPLAELIVHPRTAAQQYRGTVDLAAFEYIATHAAMPVCYNGDIVSADQFRRLQSRFPVIDSWMIGRGLVRNPFLPMQIKNPETERRLDHRGILRRFHDSLLFAYRKDFKNTGPLLGAMKELWSYLALSFVDGAAYLKKIRKARTLDSYRGAVDALFASNAPWQPEL